MSLILDAALAYAARGWPVLALHTNTQAGCTCRSARCKSPGKHPRTDLSPDGWKSATTDPKIITGWPEGINIGISLGGDGLMAFDVDDREVATSLMAPDMVLSDETGVVVTGRPGVHVYFTCTGDTRTRHLNLESGEKLGEVRGSGSYVVAPPSIAASLKPYRWVNRPRNDFTPSLATTTDALAYTSELLRAVGVVAVPAGTGAVGEEKLDKLKGVPLELRGIPSGLEHKPELLRVRQILSGTLPKTTEPDRSGQLFRMAREICSAGLRYRVNFKLEDLAGVVKAADEVYYGKYTGQRGGSVADQAIRGLALKAMQAARLDYTGPSGDGGKPKAKEGDLPPKEAPPTGSITSETYHWDAEAGKLYHMIPRQKSMYYQPVANFLPTLLAEVTVDRGGGDTETVWRARFQLKDGRSELIELRSEHHKSSHAMEEALATMVGSKYIIHAGMHKHIKVALQELTPPESVERYKRRAVPGWYEHAGGRAYLLPGIRGALGVDGIDTAIRMRDVDDLDEADPISEPALRLYGVGVRPPSTDTERKAAWGALVTLVDSGKPEITIPIVLQVLAGPLRAAGADGVPPLIHVVGPTGELKSALCCAVLSLFGTFSGTAPASWLSASPTIIRSLMYAAKDLTLCMDDYKVDGAISPAGLLEIVQNYADKTARRRATPQGKRRKAEPPRCILLSNGEDRWDTSASAVARTIVVLVGAKEIDGPKLAKAQELVTQGRMQLFGGAYLQWLAGQDDLFANRTVDSTRERLFQKMMDTYSGPAAHRRILQSAATLLAVGQVLRRFAKETQPEYEPIVLGWLRNMWAYFIQGVEERAKEVAALSPFRQLTSTLAHALAAQSVCLFPADGMGMDRLRYPATPGADVVGWWSQAEGGPIMAHLSEALTFSWYKVHVRREGGVVQFGWQAFLQEARNGHEGQTETRRFYNEKGNRHQLRVVTLQLDTVLGQAEEWG